MLRSISSHASYVAEQASNPAIIRLAQFQKPFISCYVYISLYCNIRDRSDKQKNKHCQGFIEKMVLQFLKFGKNYKNNKCNNNNHHPSHFYLSCLPLFSIKMPL